MFAEKRQKLDRMKTEALLKTAARSQVRQRDPGVLRVPDNRRDRAKSEHSEQQI